MRALSVKQPWASNIADGFKTIEVRTWKTNYRGDLLICSSKKPDNNSQKILEQFAKWGWEPNYILGKAICIVELYDITKYLPEHEFNAGSPKAPENCFAWHLRNVRKVEPFPVTGKLGFFSVPDELIQVVE